MKTTDSKIHAPTSEEAPTFNLQAEALTIEQMEGFEIWGLEFDWCLALGI